MNKYSSYLVSDVKYAILNVQCKGVVICITWSQHWGFWDLWCPRTGPEGKLSAFLFSQGATKECVNGSLGSKGSSVPFPNMVGVLVTGGIKKYKNNIWDLLVV